jgi:hypothetical protein
MGKKPSPKKSGCLKFWSLTDVGIPIGIGYPILVYLVKPIIKVAHHDGSTR